MLELKRITEENFHECLGLKSGIAREEFVDSVVYSLSEAWLYGEEFQPRVIYQADELIGFVSFYIKEGHYQIINFLISENFQGQGVGKKAFWLCAEYLKAEYGATQISIPVHQEHVLAKKFWKNIGFQESDNIEDNYIFMRLSI